MMSKDEIKEEVKHDKLVSLVNNMLERPDEISRGENGAR
ncbi:MAG: hypothetical protein C5S45_05830 [Candidatus Methanocomedens sp.]|nr:MAG: hypothetical protein C5S45_05830 [ANME-2 cluster archaeon]